MVIGMVIFSGVTLSVFMTLYVIPTAYIWLAKNTSSPLERTHKLEELEETIEYRKGELDLD